MLVTDTRRFKNCWSCSSRINVKYAPRKSGRIIFHCKEFGVKLVIGNDAERDKEQNAEQESGPDEIKHEVPTYPFRGLFKYIGSSKAQFEILKTAYPDFIIRHNHYSTYAAFDRVINYYPSE